MRVVRERVEHKKLVLKRHRGDKVYIVAGSATELKHGQIMAMKIADGKLYPYLKTGTGGINIPIGVYTGETITSAKDFEGSITTLAEVSKTLTIGVDFLTDFGAILELQKFGTFIVCEIEGKEVNE